MNRRELLTILGCSAAAPCFLVGAPAANRSSRKPNIIFLLTDDQRDNTFGIMGHHWVKTPNIDKLIKKGVRFSNAYIAEPTCCPSRVAMFTGTHERVNGVGFSSSYKLNDEQWSKSYPALLKSGGYYTGFIACTSGRRRPAITQSQKALPTEVLRPEQPPSGVCENAPSNTAISAFRTV